MHNVILANGHVLYSTLGFKVYNISNRQSFSAHKQAATDVFLHSNCVDKGFTLVRDLLVFIGHFRTTELQSCQVRTLGSETPDFSLVDRKDVSILHQH